MLSEDLPIHRYAMKPPEGGAWRAKQNALVGHRGRLPHAHPRAPRPRRARCARATSRTARQVGWESTRLDARPQRRPHARPDVGARARRHQPPRGRAARLGPDGALPAADRAATSELTDEEVTHRAAPYAIQRARRRPRSRTSARTSPATATRTCRRSLERLRARGRGRAHRGRRPRRRLVDPHRGPRDARRRTSSRAPRC